MRPQYCTVGEQLIAAAAAVVALLVMCSSCIEVVRGADPDPLQDYCVADGLRSKTLFLNGMPCKNPETVTADDFRSSALTARRPGLSVPSFGVTSARFAQASTFAGLNTQGLAMSRVELAPKGAVAIHVHPRASELLLVLSGTLSLGFLDQGGRLFMVLRVSEGEVFVFPRGVPHFNYNPGATPALFISAYNSQNPGLIFTCTAANVSGVPPAVLKPVPSTVQALLSG